MLQGHEFLSGLNPTLPLNRTAAYAGGYKCYTVEVLFGEEKHQRGHARGCTFAEVDFCSGWSSSTEIVNCTTCLSEDPNSCDDASSMKDAMWIELIMVLVLAFKTW